MFSIDTNPKTNLWGGTPNKGRWATVAMVMESPALGHELVKFTNVFATSTVNGMYILSFVDDNVEMLEGGTVVREFIVPIARMYSISFEYSIPTKEEVLEAHMILNAMDQDNQQQVEFFNNLANVNDDDIPQG